MSLDRKAALHDDLVTAQRALLEVLDHVGHDDWTRASPNDDWTLHDVLTHLSTSESGFLPTLRRMAAGDGGVPSDFDPNRWNASQLRRRGQTPPEQLRQDLEAAHHEMLSLLAGLDDAALDRRGFLSTGVEGSTEENFRLVAFHKRGHTDEIRDALAKKELGVGS